MGKKHKCCLPPGALDEIITRLEKVEGQQAALEGAIRAFIVVFGIRRIPDNTGERRETDTT